MDRNKIRYLRTDHSMSGLLLEVWGISDEEVRLTVKTMKKLGRVPDRMFELADEIGLQLGGYVMYSEPYGWLFEVESDDMYRPAYVEAFTDKDMTDARAERLRREGERARKAAASAPVEGSGDNG